MHWESASFVTGTVEHLLNAGCCFTTVHEGWLFLHLPSLSSPSSCNLLGLSAFLHTRGTGLAIIYLGYNH